MTTKKYETVLIEKQDGITWLIMNRPDKRNAMSPQLHLEMDDALAELAVDPQTQVLVLTGAGEAFCARTRHQALFPRQRRCAGGAGESAPCVQSVALAQALELSAADHRHGQRLLLRRRLHPGLRLRFRDRRG
jgi:enoyl-CoA hydratase/carnithine racemase